MDNGHVRLWRKSLDSEVFQNKELWQLWTWCLMRASHKDAFVSLTVGRGDTTVKVLRGQFIFGRDSCAKALKCPPGSIPKRIKKLQDMGNIKVKSNNQYSIVTICNWKLYQPTECEREQPRNNQGTTKEQPRNTDKKKDLKPSAKEIKGKKDTTEKPLVPERFLEFLEVFGDKRGKKDALASWQKINPDDALADKIIAGAKRYAIERVGLEKRKLSSKMAQGWLTGERWEDESTHPAEGKDIFI